MSGFDNMKANATMRGAFLLAIASVAIPFFASFFSVPREAAAKAVAYTRNSDDSLAANGSGKLVKAVGDGKLVIGKNVTGIEENYGDFEGNITSVSVEKGNKFFASKDGVLYNKKMTTLIYYPLQKKDVSFTVPKTVKKIRKRAFWKNGYLKDIVLNDGLEVIEPWAFCNTSIENVNLPGTLSSIGGSAFEGANIERVDIPSSVSEIGGCVFSGCEKLAAVNNYAKFSAIGTDMFFGCKSLEKFEIGSDVKEIGQDAFRNCGAYIDVDGGNSVYASKDGALYTKDMKELIKYPGQKVGDYHIPESVTAIDEHAFENCTGLTGLTLNDAGSAFYIGMLMGCTSLKTIVFSKNTSEATKNLYPDLNLPSLEQIILPDENNYYSLYDGALYSADYKELFLAPSVKESLRIHEDAQKIWLREYANNYDEITVPSSSGYFASYKGVLYDKKMETVELLPGGMVKYEMPASVKNAYILGRCLKFLDKLEKIEADAEKKTFSSKDGILYRADGQTLVAYPHAKKGKYVIPEGVLSMGAQNKEGHFYREPGDNMFEGARFLTEVDFPSSMEVVSVKFGSNAMLKKIVFKEGILKVRLYGGEDAKVGDVWLPSTTEVITLDWAWPSTVFHGYDNTGEYSVIYDDEDDVDYKIDGVKEYVKENGYIYKSRGSAPSKVKIKSASKKGQKCKISWGPVKGADGYEVFYGDKEKHMKYIKGSSRTSVQFNYKKYGKTKVYRICAYKLIKGRRIVGKKSKKVLVTTKSAADYYSSSQYVLAY